MIYLVRHADAKSRSNWDDDDVDRPLTKRGFRQADELVDLLEPATIGRVLSSPAVRCIATVAPVAARAGVEVESTDALLEGAPTPAAFDLLEAAVDAATTTVLCTHGDLVPALLRNLSRNGVAFDDEPRWPKGSTWVLATDGGAVTRARFLPPPAG